MAYGDYQHCCICDAKAFYDADIDWSVQNCAWGTGLRVLCRGCEKTHEIIVRKKDETEEDPTK